MKTVTVELRNKNALRLLKELEDANIIRVLEKNSEKEKTRPSVSLRVAICKLRSHVLYEHLSQLRNKWEDRNS